MKPNFFSLSFKMWITFLITIVLSILFAYSLSHYYYKHLYVEKLKTNMVDVAAKLAADYQGGEITEEYSKQVEWLNTKVDSEIFIVSNPRELSACLPFEIDYDSLISEKERQQLIKGEVIDKEGFEERFNRKIVAAVTPLVDEGRLEGIIYTYVPVDSITEVLQEFAYKWLAAAVLFVIAAIFLGTKWLKRLFKPIKEIEEAAKKVSEGDYSIKVNVNSRDEIGSLGAAFNEMANSIYHEEAKKREFIENVSHELRTPLSYVTGYTQAILDDVVKDEDQKKYLTLILSESNRLEKLVTDLMDLAKMNSEQVLVNQVPIALAQFLEDFFEKYTVVMKERGLILRLTLDPDSIIIADESQVKQILHNLIDNAMNYSRVGGVIDVQLTKESEQVIVRIKDTGIGIPKEDIPQVMDRFYRVNKARSRFDGGTGLGLSIVKQLVVLQKGTVKIESEVGKGTTVIVSFPSGS